MIRSVPWLLTAATIAFLPGCGEDSANQPGGGSHQYTPDGGGADSGMNVDAEAGVAPDVDAEAGVAPDVDAEAGVAPDVAEDSSGSNCVPCTPSEIPFDLDGGNFAQVSIYLDVSQTPAACESFTGFHDPETLVIDDSGNATLDGSFGDGWTPSEPSAGNLIDGGSYWGWSEIPRNTRVTVTVTHTDGTEAVLDFTVNDPPQSSVTIHDTCFL